MDFDYQLKTLPPEALEVIRYYGTLEAPIAYANQIVATTHLSERAFGRAIRRLVTRGYLNMDGEGRYRLTDLGRRAVDAFKATDDGTDYAAEIIDTDDTGSFASFAANDWNAPTDDDEPEPDNAEDFSATRVPDMPPSPPLIEARTATRRLVVALPQTLIAEQPATVHVGFDSAADRAHAGSADLLVRLSVLNGEPARAQDWSLTLDADSARRTYEVTAGKFSKARLRVHVFQLLDDGNEVEQAGGLYVDVDVADESDATAPLAAFAADVPLSQ